LERYFSAGTCAGTSTRRSVRGTTSRARSASLLAGASGAGAEGATGVEGATRRYLRRPERARERPGAPEGAWEERRILPRAALRRSTMENTGRTISPDSGRARLAPERLNRVRLPGENVMKLFFLRH